MHTEVAPRVVLVLVLLVAAIALRASGPVRGAATFQAERPTDGGRSFTYDASVDPASRAAIERAVASARPEAQGLITAVDGLTEVSVGRPASGALGTTQGTGGRYAVVLDLGATQQKTGDRGVVRLVLHELGHVVDFQLVPDGLKTSLDAGIPAGAPCPAGTRIGSCAPRAERFAETFAKWAMGNDLGANLYIGYAVPPPSAGFDAWAAPLVALG